jgi:hypothetical protein
MMINFANKLNKNYLEFTKKLAKSMKNGLFKWSLLT